MDLGSPFKYLGYGKNLGAFDEISCELLVNILEIL
jgi:hypothetical protein